MALRGGQTDTAYDGAWVGAGYRAYPRGTPMRDIPLVLPSDGRQTFQTGVYVNGIQTDLATQITDRIIPLDSLVSDGLEPLDRHEVLGKVLIRIQEAPSAITDS